MFGPARSFARAYVESAEGFMLRMKPVVAEFVNPESYFRSYRSTLISFVDVLNRFSADGMRTAPVT